MKKMILRKIGYMKRITLLIISLMLCLLLTACGNSEATLDKYITYAERDWWLRDETSPNTPEEKTVTFEGVEYHAFYDESTRPASRHNVSDKYVTEDHRVELHFNSLSGDFSGIFFIGAVTEKYDEADIENSHNKALEKAKLLASEYINPDEYVLTEEQYPYYRGGEENAEIGPHGEGRVIVYDFAFTKEQNDFETSDAVFIKITSKGDLRSFHVFDKGLFSQREVPKIDKDKLSRSIDENLKKTYSGNKFTYEIGKQTLTLSPEEKVIVVSPIVIDIKDKYKTAILLVTEIE